MKVLRGEPKGWTVSGPTALTVGVFDGVHLGHQKVIGSVTGETGRPTVVTFDVHPLSVVAPEHAPRLLTTLDQRLRLFADLGVELVGILPFSEVRGLSPAEFVEEILVGALQAELVAVGQDFRFGHDRSGDVSALRALGKEHGFEVEAVQLVGNQAEALSSSRIRRAVAEGRMEEAARSLGRWHEVLGRVVEGDRRGRDIGVPTANLELPDGLVLPARGVYAGWGRVRGARLPAAINVGIRPMFPAQTDIVEAHLIDFQAELYGEDLAVSFCRRLREEQTFDSVDDLVAQMERDIAQTREVVGGFTG